MITHDEILMLFKDTSYFSQCSYVDGYISSFGNLILDGNVSPVKIFENGSLAIPTKLIHTLKISNSVLVNTKNFPKFSKRLILTACTNLVDVDLQDMKLGCALYNDRAMLHSSTINNIYIGHCAKLKTIKNITGDNDINNTIDINYCDKVESLHTTGFFHGINILSCPSIKSFDQLNINDQIDNLCITYSSIKGFTGVEKIRINNICVLDVNRILNFRNVENVSVFNKLILENIVHTRNILCVLNSKAVFIELRLNKFAKATLQIPKQIEVLSKYVNKVNRSEYIMDAFVELIDNGCTEDIYE